MSEWKKVKLKDCCHSISDGDHLPPPKSNSGIPFVTIANIDATNHIDFGNTMFVPLEYYNNLNDIRKAKCNDILYSVVGSFGKPVLIKENIPFAFQRHIAILRPNNEIADSRFLYYVMLTRDFFMQADTVAIGVAQRTISLTALRNMEVKLPSMETQYRIANILSRYDSLIENYQKQIKLLEESAQRLYKEWFIDLHFPGHENTKIVDGVPEGWELKSVTNNHLFDVAKCRIALFNGNKTYYATADVEGTYFCNSGVKIEYDNKPSRAQIQPSLYSVWFARMSNSFKIVGFVEQNNNRREDAILSSGFAGFESHYERFGFLYCLISSQWFNDQKDRYATGATQVSITNEGLSRIRCLLPTTRLAEEFSLVTNKIIEETILYRENCTMLTEARDRLLPKLMSGEITV